MSGAGGRAAGACRDLADGPRAAAWGVLEGMVSITVTPPPVQADWARFVC